MIQSLADFPARQEPATFNVEKVLAKLESGPASG
jgi:hypothetical protein